MQSSNIGKISTEIDQVKLCVNFDLCFKYSFIGPFGFYMASYENINKKSQIINVVEKELCSRKKYAEICETVKSKEMLKLKLTFTLLNY